MPLVGLEIQNAVRGICESSSKLACQGTSVIVIIFCVIFIIALWASKIRIR